MLPDNLSDKYICIAEGQADESLFARLCAEAGVGSVVFDSPTEEKHGGYGKDYFYKLLEGLPVTRGFREAKGIVLIQDSDESFASVLSNVIKQLRKANKAIEAEGGSYGLPDALLKVAVGKETPPILVLSVPWIDQLGSIESLLLAAAETKYSDLKNCVDSFVECADKPKTWSVTKKAKMRLGCMVAATIEKNPTAGIKQLLSASEFEAILSDKAFDQVRSFFLNLDTHFS